MNELHMMWIRIAGEATSYRRMYVLAVEIIGSDVAARNVRRAARRVIRTLEDVIDKPIADALHLARARKRFQELEAALASCCELQAAV